jgi:signal transduction histidine kinase
MMTATKPDRASGMTAMMVCLALYLALDWIGGEIARGTPPMPPWNPGVALIIVLLLLKDYSVLPLLTGASVIILPSLMRGFDAMSILRHLAELVIYGLAARALRGPCRIDPDLRNFEDVFRFVAVTSLAAAVMAGLSVLLPPTPNSKSIIMIFQRHWLADMIGIAVLAPLILVHRATPISWITVRTLLRWESVAQAIAILGTLDLMFPRVVGSRFYPMFIPLVWVAARFGLAGVAAVLLPIQLCFVTAMVGLNLQANQEVKLQILMLSLALTGLLLGAIISERERARAAAIESENRLRALRADLDRRRFEIEHASRSSLTGELAAALAHELNQPLTAIANYIGACQRTLQSQGELSQAIDQMDKAAVQAARAGQVIRRLREFFCNDQLKAEAVAVTEMIDDVLTLMADEVIRAGASVKVDVGQDLVARVDKLQIEQVLINLVRNSLDALADHGRKQRVIEISASVSEAMIRISLQDTGPGIEQEIKDSLFSPFTTTRSFGMGLGLSISRSIIQAHGGRMWVDHRPGQGALLHFTLPAGAST